MLSKRCMPSFSDITQRDWLRALPKLGIKVVTGKLGGKGSHIKVFIPNIDRPYTIQTDLNKLINEKIFKKLVLAGFSEEQIWEALQ